MDFARRNREALQGNGSGAPYGYMPPVTPDITFQGYDAGPGGALRAMSKDGSSTCVWWRSLTWAQRLAQTERLIMASSPFLRGTFSGPAVLPAGEVYYGTVDPAVLAHAIDAYCLGQGIREVGERQAMDTAVDGPYGKASGAPYFPTGPMVAVDSRSADPTPDDFFAWANSHSVTCSNWLSNNGPPPPPNVWFQPPWLPGQAAREYWVASYLIEMGLNRQDASFRRLVQAITDHCTARLYAVKTTIKAGGDAGSGEVAAGFSFSLPELVVGGVAGFLLAKWLT